MLRIYVGNELLELTQDDLANMYIDSGDEAKIYRYGDEVLKIHLVYPKKCVINEHDAERLSVINTKRILLPKRIIYSAEDQSFLGYSLSFIDKEDKDTLPSIILDHFLSELDIINSDVKNLSDKGVQIEDLHMGNVLYNGKFFIGDPGSFCFKTGISVKEMYYNNLHKLNKFVIWKFFKMIPMTNTELFLLVDRFDEYEYIGDQIRDDVRPDESIRQYVKRIIQ